MSARSEISILTAYILSKIPGEPSMSQGAGETAVRLLKNYRTAMKAALKELGVPEPDYPAPVANAHNILRLALNNNPWESDDEA